MKKSNLVFAFTLFAVAALFSSCANKGCKGGWYGNRNLSSVTPEVEQTSDFTATTKYYSTEVCAE